MPMPMPRHQDVDLVSPTRHAQARGIYGPDVTAPKQGLPYRYAPDMVSGAGPVPGPSRIYTAPASKSVQSTPTLNVETITQFSRPKPQLEPIMTGAEPNSNYLLQRNLKATEIRQIPAGKAIPLQFGKVYQVNYNSKCTLT